MGEVKRVGAWATESVSGSRSKTTVTTTMERRKFTIGLGALATGSAAAVGTGAFTSVEADRQVDVTVEDDADAYLGLQNSDGPNDTYFEGQDDGAAALDFSDSGNSGSGVNPNAETEFDSVFQIVNQGTQEVTVSLSGDGDIVAGEDDASELSEGEIGIALASGGTIDTGHDVEVNVAVSTGDDTSNLSGTLTISADAT